MGKASTTTTTTKKKGKKTEKAPAVDKLLVPAIGICLALLGYQFFQGMATASIDRVDVQDDLALKEVFFGEVSGKQSYAVLCHDDDKDSKIPISSVFQDAATSGSSPANFRVLDCNHVLPDSEKTIAERFKLDLKKRPTIFVSGAVGEPKQVPSKHLKTGKMLDKLLKNMLEPRAAKIETTQELRTKCLNQPTCGLLLKGSKSVDSATKSAIQKLLVEQPKMVFASIDSSNLYLKGLEHEFPEFRAGRHRFVVFQKVSGGMAAGDGRLMSSYAAINGSGVSYGQMSNLCSSVLSKSQEMTKVSTLPMVKTRSKKLEEEERAKRDRLNNNKGSSSSSSSFTANDGSKEGRRAEREKRRAEHREQTGAREKTPEEIQEMERQRRLRMEAAQDAWTVQDNDDLPPEGNAVYEEDEYTMEDANDVDDDADDGDSGDDGDDVMDLD